MILKAFLPIRGACIAAGLTLFCSLPVAARNPAALIVDVNGDLVTVTANSVPVREIIEEIGMQAGIILYSGAALDTLATLAVKNKPIPQVIRRILKNHNFTLHYVTDSVTGRPVFGSRLWILPQGNVIKASSWSSGEQTQEWTLKYTEGDTEKNRLLAVSHLATEDDKYGVEEKLLAAMNDPLVAVREEAAYGLGELNEPASVSLLKNALYDSDQRVRFASIAALAETGSDDATIALSQLLNDQDDAIRSEAIHALADIGGSVANQFLHQALADSNEINRETAADYLAESARLTLEK